MVKTHVHAAVHLFNLPLSLFHLLPHWFHRPSLSFINPLIQSFLSINPNFLLTEELNFQVSTPGTTTINVTE